jgi:hypothetical protein
MAEYVVRGIFKEVRYSLGEDGVYRESKAIDLVTSSFHPFEGISCNYSVRSYASRFKFRMLLVCLALSLFAFFPEDRRWGMVVFFSGGTLGFMVSWLRSRSTHAVFSSGRDEMIIIFKPSGRDEFERFVEQLNEAKVHRFLSTMEFAANELHLHVARYPLILKEAGIINEEAYLKLREHAQQLSEVPEQPEIGFHTLMTQSPETEPES